METSLNYLQLICTFSVDLLRGERVWAEHECSIHTNRYTEIPNQNHQKVNESNTIWIRGKNHHHHRWLEFFSTCGYGCFFCSTFSGKPLPIRIYLEHVWWSKKTAEAAAAAIINFGIWLWCVNHRAIYCDLIDFLCGKQLKRNSDVHDCER